jgi:hypothetical protein
MKNQTTVIVKDVAKRSKILIKNTNIKVDKAIKSIKKVWKAEQPRRDKYKKTIKTKTNKFLKNSIRIGSDVIKTIKKDLGDFKK